MTLPASQNISMKDVNKELNASETAQISLNDALVRTLFQNTTGNLGQISMQEGLGKSNISPPTGVVLSKVLQTSLTVTWNPWVSLPVNGQVDYYQVAVYDLSNNRVFFKDNILKTDLNYNTVNIATGISASTDHSLAYNYVVKVLACNVSASKETAVNLLTLETAAGKASTPVVAYIPTNERHGLRITSSVANATSYNIYEVVSGIDVKLNSTPIVAATLSYDHTGLNSYSSHIYKVEGISTGNTTVAGTAYSVNIQLSDACAPFLTLPDDPIPAVFTTPVSTKDTITIGWTDSTSPRVSKYHLLVTNKDTLVEVYNNVIARRTALSVSLTGLTVNQEYTVVLTTINEASEFYSTTFTTTRSAWTTTVAVTPAPSASVLADPTLGQRRLSVSWTTVTGGLSYKLSRTGPQVINSVVTTTTQTFAVVPTIVGTTATFIDGDPANPPLNALETYSSYTYTVTAVNSGGDSLASVASAPTRTKAGPANAVTVTVVLADIADTSVTARWTDPGGQINSFNAILKTSGGVQVGTAVSVTWVDGQTNYSATFSTSITQDTVYYVTVQTLNSNTPATADSLTFRTKFTKPSTAIAVTQVSDTTLGKTTLSLQWDAVTGATYKIVRNGKDSSSGVTEAKTFSVSPTINSGTGKATFIDGDPLTTTVLVSYELYYYNLILVNTGGDSIKSADSNSVRTLPDRPKAPATVTINKSDITSSTVIVSWSTALGQVTNYTVTLTDENGGTLVEKTGITSTSTTLGQTPWTALTAATKYGVIITTTNTNTDTSQASTTVKYFATKTTVPVAPTVTSATSSSFAVGWTTNSADAYDLIRTNVKPYMDTATGTASGTSVTLTFLVQISQPFATNDIIIVSGLSPAAYNGTFTVTGGSTSTVQYTALSSPGSASSGVGVIKLVTNTTSTITSPSENPYTNAGLDPYSMYTYVVVSKMTLGGDQTSPATSLKRTLPNSPVAAYSVSYSSVPAATTASLTISWDNRSWNNTTMGPVTTFDVSIIYNGIEYGQTGISGSTLTYTKTGLSCGTLYSIVITTNNGAASPYNTATKSSSITTPTVKPDAPYVDPLVAITQTTIDIKWNSVAGASSYKIDRFKYNGSSYVTDGTQITGIGSVAYHVTGLSVKTNYKFTVIAFNGFDSIASDSSAVITTLANIEVAPATVTASATANAITATVQWPANSNADTYRMRRTPVAPNGTPGTEEAYISLSQQTTTVGSVTTVNATQTYTDSATNENSKYYYKIVCYTTGGESATPTQSNTVITNYTKPGTPGTISITNLSYNQFTATWSAGTGTVIDTYTATVYNTASPPVIVYPATVINSPTVTYNFGNPIAANTNYTVHVTATNNGGTGNPQTKSVLTFPPPAPPSATAGTTGLSVVVTWTALVYSSSTVTYNVYANGTALGNKVVSNLSFASTSGTYTHTTTKGTAYVYYVEAVNASGGTMSTGSTSITTPDVPGAPTIGAASLFGTTSTGAVATVNWTAPGVTGGSAITGYKITSSNGETATAISTATSVNINIASATECTFTVKATNAVGDSTASSASGKVCGLRPPTLSAPEVTAAGNQLVVTVAATDSATDWQVQIATDATWPNINVLGTFFAYTAKTTATTVNRTSTTNFNFAAFQKKVINGTTYYSGPAYAHGTITVTSVANEVYVPTVKTEVIGGVTYTTPVWTYTIPYLIPNTTVLITMYGGSGGGGGAGGGKDGGAGGRAPISGSSHLLPAGTTGLTVYVGGAGGGGSNNTSYADPNGQPGYGGDGYSSGGNGGLCGWASTSSGYGGGGGGASGVDTITTVSPGWLGLMITGGGGGGGGGMTGNAGNVGVARTSLNVMGTEAQANVGGFEGWSGQIDGTTAANSTAAGGGGGAGGNGAASTGATGGGGGGQTWWNTTTVVANSTTAPNNANGPAGGAGGVSTAAVASAAAAGVDGKVTLSYTKYVPSNLATGQS